MDQGKHEDVLPHGEHKLERSRARYPRRSRTAAFHNQLAHRGFIELRYKATAFGHLLERERAARKLPHNPASPRR